MKNIIDNVPTPQRLTSPLQLAREVPSILSFHTQPPFYCIHESIRGFGRANPSGQPVASATVADDRGDVASELANALVMAGASSATVHIPVMIPSSVAAKYSFNWTYLAFLACKLLLYTLFSRFCASPGSHYVSHRPQGYIGPFVRVRRIYVVCCFAKKPTAVFHGV